MSLYQLNEAISDMASANNCSRRDLDIDGMMRAALASLFGNADPESIEDAVNAALQHQEDKWSEAEYWNARSREHYARIDSTTRENAA